MITFQHDYYRERNGRRELVHDTATYYEPDPVEKEISAFLMAATAANRVGNVNEDNASFSVRDWKFFQSQEHGSDGYLNGDRRIQIAFCSWNKKVVVAFCRGAGPCGWSNDFRMSVKTYFGIQNPKEALEKFLADPEVKEDPSGPYGW